MITRTSSAVVSAASVGSNRRRKSRHSSFKIEYNAAHTLTLVLVGLLIATISKTCGNTILVAYAVAPPHPDLLEERDFKKRRRLQDRDAPPMLDDNGKDEICRYLSDEKCDEYEEDFKGMSKKSRNRIIEGQKKANNGGLQTFNAMLPHPKDSKYVLKTLVILVAWKDQADRIDWISRDDVDRMWNGFGSDHIIPTGSIKNFTERQAYDTIRFEADVIDWQVTDNTEAYYADQRSGMPKNGDREPHLRTAFHVLLNKMDAENFPWGDYDSDNDGIIDSVQFVHSGYGAELGGTDCYTGATSSERIWAHAIPEGQGKWTSAKTGLELGGFSISSVFREKCQRNIARLGVTMHEFYHTLGLPDLYDRDQPYAGISGRGGLGGIGIFDMMACPFGTNNNQMYPGSLSPWSKLEMGFLKEPIEITESGFYTARPSNLYPDIYSIKKGYPEGEMLLLENRQSLGFDATLPSGGMLIYKIDDTIDYNGNRKRGFPGQVDYPTDGAHWPGNGMHYPVALLQADGDYDLEQGYNNGDAGDFYNDPSQELGYGNGEFKATNSGTYPNTDSYVDGKIWRTYTTIDGFREEPEGSGIFMFRVTFSGDTPVEWQGPATNPPTNKPTKPPTKPPTEKPTNKPTQLPTKTPTLRPTNKVPTEAPTNKPTNPPVTVPTDAPSNKPTKAPTQTPTESPTKNPTQNPTKSPTKSPTNAPTKAPTPTKSPTTSPTESPTESPSGFPTHAPIEVSECGHLLEVNITTDEDPQEITWEILKSETGHYMTGYKSSSDLRPRRELEAFTEYSWKICVLGNETEFIFRMFDTGQDGLKPPGKYSVGVDGQVVGSGGAFSGFVSAFEFDTEESK